MGQNNHSGNWGINPPPQKHPPPPDFLLSPSPFLGNLTTYIGFPRSLLKVGSFSKPQKY